MQRRRPPTLRPAEPHDHQLSSWAEDPMHFAQHLGDRNQVSHHIRREDTVEARPFEGQPFSNGDHPTGDRTPGDHFGGRIEGDYLSIVEYGSRSSGSRTQVEHPSVGQVLHTAAAPLLLLTERDQPVDEVVPAGDPIEQLRRVRRTPTRQVSPPGRRSPYTAGALRGFERCRRPAGDSR